MYKMSYRMEFLPYNVEFVYHVLNFIFFAYFIRSKANSKEDFRQKLEERANYLKIKSLLRDIYIFYEETLWAPEDEGSIGNIVEVKLAIDPAHTYCIKLDFRKPVREGTMMLEGSKFKPVDIFNIKFERPKGEDYEFLDGVTNVLI